MGANFGPIRWGRHYAWSYREVGIKANRHRKSQGQTPADNCTDYAVTDRAQVLEQADTRDAEDTVGVDLDDGLGPEGDVAGQIEATEAHGSDVARWPAPGDRGAPVHEGVVAARVQTDSSVQ